MARALADALLEPLLGAPQLILGPPALREVTRDFGEAEQRTVAVVDSCDDDVRPESRAVLAKAPSLVLHPAFRQRSRDLTLQLARSHVLGRIEAGEVLTEDLVLIIALEPARPF